MKSKLGRTVAIIAVLGLSVASLAGIVWAQSSDFSYSEASGAVVVRYTRTPGELAGPDTSTTVTVYGNGRVIVHYPPFGARRGDYEMTLSKAELDELVATLVYNDMVEYDAKAVATERQAITVANNTRFYVADADISTFEIGLTSYSLSGAPTRINVQRQVTVSALQAEAQQFPGIQSLVDLAAAERHLLKLVSNANLSQVNN